jgi:hypothetical protein
MSGRAANVWARLQAAGAAEGERLGDDTTHWALAALTGVAAWVAAAFLFGFFLTAFDRLWDAPALASAMGAGCCVLAWLLLRIAHGRDFIEQFAIATSLVGQLLIGMALTELLESGDRMGETLLWAGVAAVALAMYALGRPALHRFLCGLVFAGALYGVCQAQDGVIAAMAPLVLAWTALALWWRSVSRDRIAPAWPPLAWALSAAALIALWFVEPDRVWSGTTVIVDDSPYLIAEALGVPLLPACVWWLLSRPPPAPERTRLLGFALAAVFALLWWRAPGVGFGVVLALTGFALYRPALLGLGLLGIGMYLLRYYYQLQLPLTEKAGWLFVGGALLLAARWAVLRIAHGRTA